MGEIVEFNGVKFRRYPDSKRRSDRVYFTPGIADKQRGTKRLHEEVWIAAYGPIPDGFHIHHRDGNSLNNALANLEAIPVAEHVRHHHAGVATPAKAAHLAKIRPLTRKWHSSPEGKEWHRQHAHNSMLAVKPTPHTCETCGNNYMAVPKPGNRFCSNACKSAWRRQAGLDDEDRHCLICGGTFTVNRYSKKRTCSRRCAGRLQSQTKTSRP